MANAVRQPKIKPRTGSQTQADWQKEVTQRAQRVGQELGDGLMGVAEATATAITEVLDLGIGVLRALLGR